MVVSCSVTVSPCNAMSQSLVKLTEIGQCEAWLDSDPHYRIIKIHVSLDFSLTVKAATLIFISGFIC